MEQMSFVAAVRKYLTIDGEQFTQIAAEMRKLTPQDRIDLTADFAKIGVEITKTATA